ncbi:MAG: hypothetical protein ABIQ53_16500, partial [Terracoccus sp.]
MPTGTARRSRFSASTGTPKASRRQSTSSSARMNEPPCSALANDSETPDTPSVLRASERPEITSASPRTPITCPAKRHKYVAVDGVACIDLAPGRSVRIYKVSRTIVIPLELSVSGFVRNETNDKIVWLEGHDMDLHRFVETEQRPFIIGGRSSTASGRSGYRSAASDTHESAARLAEVTGMDVRHLLPSVDDLAMLLRKKARTQVHTSPLGGQFVNRFLLVELGSSGVVLSISTGTGAMISDELEQPHTAALERYARDISPVIAGMFFKRTDRYCRTKHGHVKLYDRLDVLNSKLGVWAGDGLVGRWDFDQPHTSMMLAMMASFGATEAKVMRKKTVVSQMRLTGDLMVDGRVAMGVPQASPPGTMRYRELESGRVFLALDTPSNYPCESKVVSLPRVCDIFGAPADQVALIQSVLARWGVDDTDPIDLFKELAAAGLSSETLRKHFGPAAAYLNEHHVRTTSESSIAHNWARTLRANLPFYETGVLTVRLVGEEKEVRGCLPSNGQWASPEDFARIRAYEEVRSARLRRARPSRWARSGWQDHPVKFNGEQAHLQGRDRRGTPLRLHGAGVDWSIARQGRAARERARSVPEESIHESIVDGLRAMEGTLLSRHLAERTSDKAVVAEARRDEIAGRLAKISGQRSRMVDRLLAEDCSESLAAEVKRRDAVMSVEEVALRAEVRVLDVELAVARQQIGADSSDLSKILSALRGEYQPGLHDAVGRAVRNLTFEAEGANGVVSWSGVLVIDDEQVVRGLWRVPFKGSYDPNASYAAMGMVGLLGLLRAGEVMRFSAGRLAQSQRDLAAYAGVPQKRLKCLAANEPDLVRLWTAVE